jgi:hypothetical protein
MDKKLFSCASLILTSGWLQASELPPFNTSWISGKPEVLTYRSTAKQSDGLYQVSVSRNEEKFEVYMNIITPGFTKSVWGAMDENLHPRESKSRIVVNNQIVMTTECSYTSNALHVATLMSPQNKLMENRIANSEFVVDFSQAPLMARVLPLKVGAEFTFSSLNPQNNTLVPLKIRVVGQETLQNIKCFKVASTGFEGDANYWVEQDGHHRVMRIEQTGSGRVSELIL